MQAEPQTKENIKHCWRKRLALLDGLYHSAQRGKEKKQQQWNSHRRNEFSVTLPQIGTPHPVLKLLPTILLLGVSVRIHWLTVGNLTCVSTRRRATVGNRKSKTCFSCFAGRNPYLVMDWTEVAKCIKPASSLLPEVSFTGWLNHQLHLSNLPGGCSTTQVLCIEQAQISWSVAGTTCT